MMRRTSNRAASGGQRWRSPETQVRWERGLLLVAGMVGAVIAFFVFVAVLPGWLSVIPGWSEDDSQPPAGQRPVASAPVASDPLAGVAPTVVASAPAAPAPTTAPAGAASTEPRLGGVSRQVPNVRRGPSTNAAILFQLSQGQRVDVVGRSSDNQWLQIINPQSPREKVWVSADMLDVTGDARTLPEARE